MQIFLEPEGRDTPELYVQGFSTGLPERLQLALLRTLPGAGAFSLAGLALPMPFECCCGALAVLLNVLPMQFPTWLRRLCKAQVTSEGTMQLWRGAHSFVTKLSVCGPIQKLRLMMHS